MPQSSSLPKPLLTIDFTGLSLFVQDQASIDDTTRIDVVMPAAGKMGLDLCDHVPMMSYYLEDFSGRRPGTRHVSYHGPKGENVGIWRIDGGELRVSPVDGSSGLTVDPSYINLLDLEDLHSGLGAVEHEWLDRWPGAMGCRFELTSGLVCGNASITQEEWGIGPTNSPSIYKRFAQKVRYHLFGDPNVQFVEIEARAKGVGPYTEAVQFHSGAHVAVSNLCAFGDDDNDPRVERDVISFYEMSTLKVDVVNRSVLHPPGRTVIQGYPTRPKVDSCPPARAYRA